jgi:hypothetical protein
VTKETLRLTGTLGVSALMLIGIFPAVHAASFVSQGHAAGAQCVATGVNNSAVVVGSCTPASVSAPRTAWMASTVGTQISLPALASGQNCSAGGITDSGTILGACRSSSNVRHAVTWQSSSPTTAPVRLLPLPGLLGLLADVRTEPASFNGQGDVGGLSIGADGDRTAVVWLSGSANAIAVSTRGDNCAPMDVSESTVNSRPAVALSCPNSAGTYTAKVAQATGLLNAYVATALAVPAGSSYCSLTAINSAMQILGTCHSASPDMPRVAFWNSPSASPVVLSNSARSQAIALNNGGNAIISFQDADGNEEAAFWNPGTGTFTVVAPIAGGTRNDAIDIADNDFVIVNSENNDQNDEAALWRSSTGTVGVGFYDNGEESFFTAVSTNGQYAVGGALDSNDDESAVITTLP